MLRPRKVWPKSTQISKTIKHPLMVQGVNYVSTVCEFYSEISSSEANSNTISKYFSVLTIALWHLSLGSGDSKLFIYSRVRPQNTLVCPQNNFGHKKNWYIKPSPLYQCCTGLNEGCETLWPQARSRLQDSSWAGPCSHPGGSTAGIFRSVGHLPWQEHTNSGGPGTHRATQGCFTQLVCAPCHQLPCSLGPQGSELCSRPYPPTAMPPKVSDVPIAWQAR